MFYKGKEHILSLEGEVWKTIPEDNRYQVSNFGRVKSFAKNPEGQIMRQNPDKDGYALLNSPFDTAMRVHRYVARAFVENDDPVNKTVVHHINDIKHDNHADNLEWVTIAENTRLGYENGVARVYSSKSVLVYFEDELVSVYDSQRHFSRETGVPITQVQDVVRSGDKLFGKFTLITDEENSYRDHPLFHKPILKTPLVKGVYHKVFLCDGYLFKRPKVFAEYFGTSTGTLKRWRSKADGNGFFEARGKNVREVDTHCVFLLDKYLQENEIIKGEYKIWE